MHSIVVEGFEPGDYLHPDQRLELVDETSGTKFELYVRGNAQAAPGIGEVSLFIPVAALQGMQTDKEFCVLTLSKPTSEREASQRRDRLAGISLPGAASAKPSNGKKRGKR